MSKKVRERAEMAWVLTTAAEEHIALDAAYSFYCKILDHIFPEVDKSSAEERAAAVERWFDYASEMDEDMRLELMAAVNIGGLKPSSKSDQIFTRSQLNKMDLLQSNPAQPATPPTWQKKQLANHNGANNAAVKPTVTSDIND